MSIRRAAGCWTQAHRPTRAAALAALLATGLAPVFALAAPAQASPHGVDLVWSPTTQGDSYNFGTLDAGAGATKTVTFTLSNRGVAASGDLSLTLSGSGAFGLSADGCSGTSLAPTGSCSVTVTFAPAPTRPFRDAAILGSQSGRGSPSLRLIGTVGKPAVEWSPSSFDFDAVPVGNQVHQTFTLTNSGSGTSAALTTSLVGSSAFTVSADACTGAELAPGANCDVTVEFAPSRVGRSYTAHLRVTGASGSRQLRLTGTGAPHGTVVLSWSPPSFDFGTVADGETPIEIFTLTNTGTGTSGTLTASLAGSSAFAITADTCTGLVLGSSESCAVTVEYSPTTTETDSTTLSAGGVVAEITGSGHAAAPGAFSASASASGVASGAVVSWSAASPGTGGTTVTYTITCNDQSTSSSVPCGSPTTSTSETVTGLTPGDTYTFGVTATNTAAQATTETSNTVTAATVPGSFSVTASVGGSVSAAALAWSVPSDGGDGKVSPLTYAITCDDETTSTSTACGSQTTATSETVTGLQVGDRYTFSVTATNADGLSNVATSSALTLALPPVPHVVTYQGCTSTDPDINLCTYTAIYTMPFPPSPTAGSCPPQNPASGGCADPNVADGSGWVTFDALGSVDPNSSTNADLEYQWEIIFPPTLQSAVYTAAGVTGWNTPMVEIAPGGLPALQGTDAGTDISWRVQLTVTDPVSGMTSVVYFRFKYENTGLTLKMASHCSAETGPWVPSTTCATAAGLPTRYEPGAFTSSASTTSPGSVAISWTAASPGTNGGPVTYSLYCYDETTATFASCGSPTTSTGENVSGLTGGDAYLFFVMATNGLHLVRTETTNTVTVE